MSIQVFVHLKNHIINVFAIDSLIDLLLNIDPLSDALLEIIFDHNVGTTSDIFLNSWGQCNIMLNISDYPERDIMECNGLNENDPVGSCI